METKNRRRSIKTKVLWVVLLISGAALLVNSIEGVVSMLRIRSKSEKALVSRMESNLHSVAESKSALVDSVLEKYAEQMGEFASYIHELYVNPEDYIGKEIFPASAENAGKYVLQRVPASAEVDEEAIREEGMLLSNVEHIFYPVISPEGSVVTNIYLGTEKGQIISYDDKSENKVGVDYYNFYESVWYQKAKELKATCFTDVYLDNFGNGLMITCATPFYDETDTFAGVVAMDVLISDLYRSAVAIEMEGAYALLVDGAGNLITPEATGSALTEEADLDESTTDKILNGDTGVSLTDKGVYYAYIPMDEVDWKFCIHVPQSLVLAPVKEMDREIGISIFLFTLGVILILLVLAFVLRKFAESLTRPLLSLGEDAREISEGNLEHRAEIHDNDEIGDLAVRFNEMAEALKRYIEDLTQVTAEKERIGAELNVATQIQADMLPGIFPVFSDKSEFDMFATMNPAKEVGGDFYDFFLVDDTHLGLVMADVSGKGVPAALFMVIAKTLIKNRALMGGSPAEVLAYANDQLCEGNEAELFVTVWMAILDLKTGKGVAANAGHEHPAIRRAGGEFELVIYRHSPAVATMEGIPFREHEFELHPGDSLFVYTDGVAEATNASNELYGTDRMLEALNRDPDAPAEKMLESVKSSVDEFVGSAPQFDDITMLGIRYFGTGSSKKKDSAT